MAFSYQTSPMASNYNPHKKFLNNGTKLIHQTQVVIVIVPFPAQGHLNQLLHLSRLISSYNLPVHFVGTTQHNRQAIVRVQGWDPKSISKNVHIHDFKVPTFISPPPNPNAKSKFPSHLFPSFEASSNLREHVATLLQSLSSVAKRVVVIYDSLMASCVQDAIHIKNCETYTFHSVSAFTMFLYFWDLMGKPELKKSKNIIPEKVPSLEGCFTAQFIDFITSQYEFHKFSNGIIYNTTRVIEKPYLELIENMISNKTHWALGPFNPLCVERKSNNKGRHFSLEWLDKQKGNSVIYVSFGTTTAFKEEQIIELAKGLEQSEQKFIWVLRDADRGDVFNEDGFRRVIELPNGFEERVEMKDIGLIVRDWAPQLEILSHSSIGGFMSHCGWNSCMESLTMGVPIATWPMHSDQPRNRVLVTEILKVGLVVRDWAHSDELVMACVVENVVRKLMATKEGDEMRQNAMNLKNEILESMDENGVSRMELDSFIAHVTR
ncbi:zeatin O-glucosyltransferase [Lathyrus oleraceus]|uniref:Glycosyltransferase n=1 Tax=Pisum sativum TaxID=3888 RepID=A0A9D4VKT2_PEA|nr:zeatin O-glucosyltransferase-like [Pisum sativum]KAI5384490.1 Zeatin O-glucosyltransferase [Pisum sativum]